MSVNSEKSIHFDDIQGLVKEKLMVVLPQDFKSFVNKELAKLLQEGWKLDKIVTRKEETRWYLCRTTTDNNTDE